MEPTQHDFEADHPDDVRESGLIEDDELVLDDDELEDEEDDEI